MYVCMREGEREGGREVGEGGEGRVESKNWKKTSLN